MPSDALVADPERLRRALRDLAEGCMWEVLGYLALGLACIACAIAVGAAFD